MKSQTSSNRTEVSQPTADKQLINLVSAWGKIDEQAKTDICLIVMEALPKKQTKLQLIKKI